MAEIYVIQSRDTMRNVFASRSIHKVIEFVLKAWLVGSEDNERLNKEFRKDLKKWKELGKTRKEFVRTNLHNYDLDIEIFENL